MGKTKYIFITGGVVSGLGKGITAASLGRLLKSRGLKVTAQKLDPYLNVDPGTMNPVQHGEVFVTDDGAETDLDLGHYERFIDESLSQNSNLTSGRVYWKVITDERKGVYGGQTIQIIPHVTNEIKRSIARNADTGADVCLVEIGGTVGDIESQPFLEAIRQFAVEAGRENCLFIHVTLVPYLAASDELKSKPTQHSVKEMLSIGINPDIIVCRTEHPLTDEIKHKISLFCNVDPECVIENNNCDILYAVPIMLHQQHMDDVVIRKLGIDCPGAPDLADWQEMLDALRHPVQTVKIGLVGKYVELHDSYISVNEALKHGGIATHSAVDIHWIDSETLEGDDVDLDAIPARAFVLFRTGRIERHAYGEPAYFHDHPQLAPELIDALLARRIRFIGIDGPGIRRHAEHEQVDRHCERHGVHVIENLCGLGDLMPGKPFTVFTFWQDDPQRTGLPCRVIAEQDVII